MSPTKTEVVVVASDGAGASFVPGVLQSVRFQIRSGQDLKDLVKTLGAVFDGRTHGVAATIALLKCSSGRFGSCLEAIKAEAMVELAATEGGHRVVKVAPQSLTKALLCAPGQTWRDRAGELFNPDGKHPNWSKGAAGSVAAAFKVAGE